MILAYSRKFAEVLLPGLSVEQAVEQMETLSNLFSDAQCHRKAYMAFIRAIYSGEELSQELWDELPAMVGVIYGAWVNWVHQYGEDCSVFLLFCIGAIEVALFCDEYVDLWTIDCAIPGCVLRSNNPQLISMLDDFISEKCNSPTYLFELQRIVMAGNLDMCDLIEEKGIQLSYLDKVRVSCEIEDSYRWWWLDVDCLGTLGLQKDFYEKKYQEKMDKLARLGVQALI